MLGLDQLPSPQKRGWGSTSQRKGEGHRQGLGSGQAGSQATARPLVWFLEEQQIQTRNKAAAIMLWSSGSGRSVESTAPPAGPRIPEKVKSQPASSSHVRSHRRGQGRAEARGYQEEVQGSRVSPANPFPDTPWWPCPTPGQSTASAYPSQGVQYQTLEGPSNSSRGRVSPDTVMTSGETGTYHAKP